MFCSVSAQLELAVLGRMNIRLFLPLTIPYLLALLANPASAQELLEGEVRGKNGKTDDYYEEIILLQNTAIDFSGGEVGEDGVVCIEREEERDKLEQEVETQCTQQNVTQVTEC